MKVPVSMSNEITKSADCHLFTNQCGHLHTSHRNEGIYTEKAVGVRQLMECRISDEPHPTGDYGNGNR